MCEHAPPSFITLLKIFLTLLFAAVVEQVVEFSGDRTEKRQYFPESDVTVSSLLIKAAHVSDSGNYTCQPAHCPPVSAKVYILKGKSPAICV